MQKLLNGLHKFQREIFPKHQTRFEELASGQSPEVLFITCADSRIDPCLMTQTQPGELFICRNAGNMVPAFGERAGGVSATIEYAVMALNVRDIVVCGHSDCGAMRALLHPEKVQKMKTVASWLEYGNSARMVVDENYSHLEGKDLMRAITEQNVLAQLNHLRTHSSVAARLQQGTISLHGWYYDIPSGSVFAYSERSRSFESVALTRRSAADEVPELVA
jgi:carbonic anhydrase